MNEARRLFELLQTEFEGMFQKAEQIRLDQVEVSELRLSLQTKLDQVNKDQLQITQDKENILKEREFFAKTIAESDLKLRSIESQRKELAEKRQQLEVEKQEVQRSREAAELIIVRAKGLEEEMKDLASQKQLIEGEKIIDRERKRILDIREEKIAKREKQLQMEVEI